MPRNVHRKVLKTLLVKYQYDEEEIFKKFSLYFQGRSELTHFVLTILDGREKQVEETKLNSSRIREHYSEIYKHF